MGQIIIALDVWSQNMFLILCCCIYSRRCVRIRVNSNRIKHRTQATVSELWYVEEYDLLALALNGRMKIREFKFGCAEA